MKFISHKSVFNILWLFEQLLGHFQFLGEFGSQTVIVALQSVLSVELCLLA